MHVVMADRLALPASVERNRPITVLYQFAKPTTGHGVLEVEWTDADGREVEHRRIRVRLARASEVAFRLDLRRAVAGENRVVARLRLDGEGPRRETSAIFAAASPDDPWRDYQIIMWQEQTPAGYARLKQLGVTGGMVMPARYQRYGSYNADQLNSLLDQDLGFYLENIATDFYSPYHRWFPHHPVNWKFLEVEKLHQDNPRDIRAFIRQPSLSDPKWLAMVQSRLRKDVRMLHPYRPLYYDLGDETGIADLGAFWDFDFSDPSLRAMRVWLREIYRGLGALNREWGTQFQRWADVIPPTTAQTIARPDENFSAWADFKEWMDIAFARALAGGSAAVHAADPHARAAIEGAQAPGWGGYDYARLARSVDLIEPYDLGPNPNIEMLRSINPQLVIFTTSFGGGPLETYRVWRRLLRGTRGSILWDPENGFAGKDGSLGARGREAAPAFAEIRRGLGALLINSRRLLDPIGVLYSPASMRVQWMLDQRARSGDPGSVATQAAELPQRLSSRNFVRAIQHLGLQPRFVTDEAISNGELRRTRLRALMLPGAIALSKQEAAEIARFVARGGEIFSDGEPGLFDQHGRKERKPLLSAIFTGPPRGATSRFGYGTGTAIYAGFTGVDEKVNSDRAAELLAEEGIRPPFTVVRQSGEPANDIETHIFQTRGITILALQRDFAKGGSNDLEIVAITLPRRSNVYDLRAHRALGETDRVIVDVGSDEPAILGLSATPLAPPAIAGPAAAHLGDAIRFRIRSQSPAAPRIFHVDVVDRSGGAVLAYSGNIIVARGTAAKLLPLALNDQPGIWKITATDVASGQTASAELRVEPRN